MSNDEYVKALRAIFERAVSIHQMARREGLLAVEGSIDTEKVNKRDIYEYGLSFVIDGIDTEFIDKILSNIIDREKDDTVKTLKTIQKEAVLSIQRGDNTRILLAIMNSYTDLPLNDAIMKNYLD